MSLLGIKNPKYRLKYLGCFLIGGAGAADLEDSEVAASAVAEPAGAGNRYQL